MKELPADHDYTKQICPACAHYNALIRDSYGKFTCRDCSAVFIPHQKGGWPELVATDETIAAAELEIANDKAALAKEVNAIIKKRTLTSEQLAALQRFASRTGRYWKYELRLLWETGRDEQLSYGGELRQVRNIFGPRWLTKFQFNNTKTHSRSDV